jgi:hypothetical protein
MKTPTTSNLQKSTPKSRYSRPRKPFYPKSNTKQSMANPQLGAHNPKTPNKQNRFSYSVSPEPKRSMILGSRTAISWRRRLASDLCWWPTNSLLQRGYVCRRRASYQLVQTPSRHNNHRQTFHSGIDFGWGKKKTWVWVVNLGVW